MSFHSGRVSFSRFRVHGDAPSAVDETTLATLAERAFQEQPLAVPAEIESGWVSGEHLFDTQFSYEKNGFGTPAAPMLLFALRIDTHKVPGEVKQAYRRMNEKAMAEQSSTGFISRREKREAKETAEQQMREELSSGKYRRSKMAPILWDLGRKVVYVAGAGNTLTEQLCGRFRDSFNLDLEPLSAGTLAGQMLKELGRFRDYEDLRPTPFTAAPPEAEHAADEIGGQRDLHIPMVPWVHAAGDGRDFLGNEFLIWLWWQCETDEGLLSIGGAGSAKSDISVFFDKALEMDCAWDVRGRQSLRASGPTKLPEAAEALAFGKWPRKAGLILADVGGDQQWEFSFQADRFAVTGSTLPPVADTVGPREMIETRLMHIQRLAQVIDGLYGIFIQQRVASGWASKRQAIRQWIAQRRAPQEVLQ